MSPATEASHAELARVVREHAGRLAASLMRVIGDFSTAEDMVQEAVVAALQRWPVDGIPERPDAWLFTVARRRGLDRLRRENNYRAKLAQLQWPVQPTLHAPICCASSASRIRPAPPTDALSA